MERNSPKYGDVFNDSLRFDRLNGLRAALGLDDLAADSTNDDTFSQQPSIGIEIEMTWDQALEDLRPQWLGSDIRPSHYPKDSAEYKEFTRRYNKNDKRLRPILEAVSRVIPRVGFDAYWEFSFNPTKNRRVLEAELTTLYEAGILCEGIPYATHVTIADIYSERDAYAVLCALEQSGGSSARRIESPLTSVKGGWSQKGKGGLLQRMGSELAGSDITAFEFRTLTTTSPQQLSGVLELGQRLVSLQSQDKSAWLLERQRIEDSLIEQGLPLRPWDSPQRDAATWRKYGATLLARS
ncbi:hypothetical protein CL689_04505 [Candidatus Saccharibacteria bacterium]|nr:hypothetical protein [Candidatus Saccharibacteria bacterium]